MGELDDTERSHLIVDKDTQMVYDVRKDIDMARLERQTSARSLKNATPRTAQNRIDSDNDQQAAQESAVQEQRRSKPKAKPWANLWKEKRQNDHDFLLASEAGNMQEMLDLIDSTKRQLQIADINTKGADLWTALHYAANEGHGDILEALIERGIDVAAVTNRQRTALHLACARGHVDISRLLCDQ